MRFEVGAVLEGKVSGITKFGAFVSLPEGKSGLVHISEMANGYVNDVHDHVQMGQTVRVRIIGINDGKINLSIRKAEEQPTAKAKDSEPARETFTAPSDDKAFEDKLKKFMQESDSRIAGNPMYADRGKSRRRR